jgi:hypothetical protein
MLCIKIKHFVPNVIMLCVIRLIVVAPKAPLHSMQLTLNANILIGIRLFHKLNYFVVKFVRLFLIILFVCILHFTVIS